MCVRNDDESLKDYGSSEYTCTQAHIRDVFLNPKLLDVWNYNLCCE